MNEGKLGSFTNYKLCRIYQTQKKNNIKDFFIVFIQ